MTDTPLQRKTLKGERLRNALAGNIIQWASAVRKIHQQIAIRPTDYDDPPLARLLVIDQHIMQAHLLILGLRQIAEHLDRMKKVRPGYKTPRFKNAAEAFLREYKTEEIRACRHLLEHQAEHLVGGGKYQHLVTEIELHRLGLRGTRRDDGTVAFYISIFGRDYHMDGIVQRVDELLAAFDEPDPKCDARSP